MTTWVRSSRCVGGDCLEARRVGRVVVVRDSKLGDLCQQTWEPWEWADLLDAIIVGGPVADGDGPSFLYGHSTIDVFGDKVVLGSLDEDGRYEPLTFTYEEWNAFVAGVLAGEFDFDKLPTPGPSSTTALDVSEAAASHRHDVAAAAAGGGANTGLSPSSAAPEPLADFALRDASASASRTAESADALGWRPGPAAEEGTDSGTAAPSSAAPGDAIDAFCIAVAEHAVAFEHEETGLMDCCIRVGLVAAYPLLREDLELKWGSGPLVQHVPEDSALPGGAGGEPAARAGDATVEPDPAYTAAGGEVVPATAVGVRTVGTTEPVTRTPGPADSGGWPLPCAFCCQDVCVCPWPRAVWRGGAR